MVDGLTSAELEAVGTGPVSDAMELMGLRRTVITGMNLVCDDPLRVIMGPAFTIRQAPKPGASAREDNLTRQRDAAGELAQAGDVVVIDAGGRRDVCSWGENLALAARDRGVAGLVAHGTIRDSERIRRSGFPVLCRGCTPVASRWDLQTEAMNEVITVDGVQITPGDWIYGDADGVIVIAASLRHDVMRRAFDIYQQEESRRLSRHG